MEERTGTEGKRPGTGCACRRRMSGNRTAACAFETPMLAYGVVFALKKHNTHTHSSLFDTAKSGVEWMYFVLESSFLETVRIVDVRTSTPGVLVATVSEGVWFLYITSASCVVSVALNQT